MIWDNRISMVIILTNRKKSLRLMNLDLCLKQARQLTIWLQAILFNPKNIILGRIWSQIVQLHFKHLLKLVVTI